MTVAVSLLVWFMLKQTGNADWNYLWFLLPLVAFPGTLWSGRKRKKMVRTYVDRIIGYVWTVFGLSAFLLSCVAVFWWDIPILFTILLLMGMGTALTGLIVGMKVVTVGGVLGALLSLGCFFIPGISQNAVFCVGLCFYDGDTGAYDEPDGLSKTRKELLMFKELNPLLHSELRLAIMSLLISVEEADFVYIRQQTGATAGNLSVQLDKLAKARYVEVTKTFKGKMPCTLCKITLARCRCFLRSM